MHHEKEGVEHEQAGETLRARTEQRRGVRRQGALVPREIGARPRVPEARAHRQDAQRVLPSNPPEAAKPAAQADRLRVHPVPIDPWHARAEHVEREEERREQDVSREGSARAPQRSRARSRALPYPVPDGLQHRSLARAQRHHNVQHCHVKLLR